MIKKGISSILLSLYCKHSFAQENVYDTNGQLPQDSEWPISIWIIFICILVIGTIMFFIGVFVNNKRQKNKQVSTNLQDVPKTRETNQAQQQSTTLLSSNPLANDKKDTCPPDEALMELQPDPELFVDNGESIVSFTPDDSKYKLLIIEDHKDIRLYLTVLFSKDYNLLMAENGEEGLKLARKELPDLVITDVMMPMMNGFECCKRIKEDLKTCHIPIIVLTALTGDENVVKGIELGADDYMAKPFNPEILRIKVKRLIKSRQELKQLYGRLLKPTATTLEEVEESVEESEDPFITQIVQIVENNLQNPEFSVKRLSEMLNMSQPTLYRRVKLLTNFTIIEFVRGVRLRRSAELLKSRKYNVQEVAEMVGYNDIPTFRKHFVDFYGTTPSTFGRDE